MASVMGAAFWHSSQQQQRDPTTASSNGSSFNFDDSGVGNEAAAGTSPLYTQLQQTFASAPPLQQTQNEGNTFNFNDGQKADRMPICSSCHQPIIDRFILRVQPNLEFHAACLKCTDCQRPLDETCTAFVRNGQTYCKDDYLRLFVGTCNRCQRQFERNEPLMRARNLAFHPDCFNCSGCARRLSIGEQFIMRDSDLFCRSTCEQPTPKDEPATSAVWDSYGSMDTTAELLADNKQTPLSLKTEVDDTLVSNSTLIQLNNFGPLLHQTGSLSSNSSVSSTSNNGLTGTTAGGGKKSKKDKPTQRVRTVLTEQQLKILKHMYTQNQRPDGATKEKLVEQTGLNQRVIRVWFQNKRCKDKKRQTALREQQEHQEKEQTLHGVRMSGIGPIVALSPTPLQESGYMNSVDIRQYAQSPSIWSTGVGPSNGTPSLADLTYSNGQSMVMSNVPVSYDMNVGQIEMPPEYAQMSLGRFGVPSNVNYNTTTVQLPIGLPNSSLSSSPACSD
ncbi:Zinc finger and Homeobox domain containing protein [Aphelenchoides besseyi]|nr:Zinc finger and Homeobox domain containing protein [Aphelenchoides besseyi]KAI6207918.1 Zinc finger and Homeobox domain containing protein [Aphelenchoides besseyi]